MDDPTDVRIGETSCGVTSFSRRPAGRVRDEVPIACEANVYRTRPATTLMVIAMIAMLNTNDNSA